MKRFVTMIGERRNFIPGVPITQLPDKEIFVSGTSLKCGEVAIAA
jgi:hypothetical protein